jgi:hypothetical protein
MSRRVRVPAPFQRLLPSVIRVVGPRLVIVAGCALVLCVGGGTYLSYLGQAPSIAPQPATPHAPSTDPQVLGASTAATNAASSISDSSTAKNSSTGSAPDASSTPACSANCAGTAPAPTAVPGPDLPSFDLTVDTRAIKHTPGLLSVPFSVVRHDGLSTPIAPARVTISAGGNPLNDLIAVRSETMIDADHGVLTLLTVGAFPHDITVNLSAHSGSATANTNFSYHIGP